MKKTTFLNLLVIISLVIFSCSSTTETARRQYTPSPNLNIKALNPEELYGKKLVGYSLAGAGNGGINKNNVFRLKINKDRTFELQRNELVYNGEWAFDINAKPLRYVFEWMMNNEKQGFNMEFHKTGNSIFWYGKRFSPDTDMSLYIQLTFEE